MCQVLLGSEGKVHDTIKDCTRDIQVGEGREAELRSQRCAD